MLLIVPAGEMQPPDCVCTPIVQLHEQDRYPEHYPQHVLVLSPPGPLSVCVPQVGHFFAAAL